MVKGCSSVTSQSDVNWVNGEPLYWDEPQVEDIGYAASIGIPLVG